MQYYLRDAALSSFVGATFEVGIGPEAHATSKTHEIRISAMLSSLWRFSRLAIVYPR